MARVYVERRELPGDLQDLLDAGAAAAECTPPFDIFETAGAIEVVMDLPGVSADAVEIVFTNNVVLIAGRKTPRGCEHRDAGFHIAERAFGRFGRAIKLEGAYDTARATATLNSGELRLVLPRLEERRGRQIRIPVRSA
jgi:HSP20 family protein